MIAQGPGWTLTLGDCIDGMRQMADGSVDVTITDPPYEAEAHTKQRRQLGTRRVPGGRAAYVSIRKTPLRFDAITPEQRIEAAAQVARVTRHCAVVFCQVEAVTAWRDAFNNAGMPYRRCIPWNKPDAMPSLHGRWPGQSFEAMVLASHTDARPCPVGGKSVSYTCVRDVFANGAPHETTKPLRLMKQLVEHYSERGDVVFDAFAGSGTTGVAACQLGRRFVGFERALCAMCEQTARWSCSWIEGKDKQHAFLCDEHRDEVSGSDAFLAVRDNYFEIACRRLRGEEAKPHPSQPSLF